MTTSDPSGLTPNGGRTSHETHVHVCAEPRTCKQAIAELIAREAAANARAEQAERLLADVCAQLEDIGELAASIRAQGRRLSYQAAAAVRSLDALNTEPDGGVL